MNRRAMSKRFLNAFAATLSLAVLAACGEGLSAPQDEPPLAGAAIGGPFELVNSKGEIVRWSDFDGRYRIVYFGYAYCPDVCPLDVSRIMRGYALFKQEEPEAAAQVQPIFISIDTERDTPEVVGKFATAFSDDLLGLTGTPEQVKAAADAYKAFYQKVGEGEHYTMNHSLTVYLMGPDGRFRTTVAEELGPERSAAIIERAMARG